MSLTACSRPKSDAFTTASSPYGRRATTTTHTGLKNAMFCLLWSRQDNSSKRSLAYPNKR